ncbi:hypothetical protein [Streptomyces roseolus]|uniref:hypothetical protein n=1 Tax=Streptomyces roseolus TaxID=67358 RepID=UPI0016763EA3|nr:hypothetical protein [Streptomyces roseolus]
MGAVLIGFYLADVLAIPYSIFAVLAGTSLMVDGGRRAVRLRRRPDPRGGQS